MTDYATKLPARLAEERPRRAAALALIAGTPQAQESPSNIARDVAMAMAPTLEAMVARRGDARAYATIEIKHLGADGSQTLVKIVTDVYSDRESRK